MPVKQLFGWEARSATMLLQGSIMITPAPFRFIAVVTREATFAELDCLLRCIWFECCGHLSSFKVQLQSC